ATDAPVSMQFLGVAGKQVAVAMGDAGNRARDRAEGGVALALVGGVLPEPPAATGPRVGHYRILAWIGQPEIALGEDGVGAHRLAQPDTPAPGLLAVGPSGMSVDDRQPPDGTVHDPYEVLGLLQGHGVVGVGIIVLEVEREQGARTGPCCGQEVLRLAGPGILARA